MFIDSHCYNTGNPIHCDILQRTCEDWKWFISAFKYSRSSFWYNCKTLQGQVAETSCIYFLISHVSVQELELWSHVCSFIDVCHFSPAILAAVSLLFFLFSFSVSFFICPSGWGQAGSEEGSQGRGQRDPHEGAGETTERGISQETLFHFKLWIQDTPYA